MSTQVFFNLLWVPYRDQESKFGDDCTQDPPGPQDYWSHAPKHTLHMPVPMHYINQLTAQQDAAVLD